jgi:hypothetical protein
VPFTRNPRFVGRYSHLDRLQGTLFAEDRPTKVALIGLGGVGKTQIALELAFRIRDRYPGCSIFWIPATKIESLWQAYLEIGQQLGISGLGGEQADVQMLVQRHLSQERRPVAADTNMWFNNARNKNNPSSLIDCLPKSSYGRLASTTRSRVACE